MSGESDKANGKAAVFGAFARDLVGIAGAASVSYGAWLIAEPAGFMVGGLFAVVGALLAARNSA